MRIVLIIVWVACSTHLYSQNTKKLISDFDYLINELRLQHQGLYQYRSKGEVDLKIDSLRGTIHTSMSKLEFYGLVRKVISLTNEGHTSCSLPKWMMMKVGLSKSFLPLAVKFCENELIVTQNYGDDIDGLKKGVKLLSINGKSIDEIKEHLFPLIATDGFNETSKYEWIGGVNLALLYRLTFGETNEYVLEIQEFGEGETHKVTIPSIRFISYKSKNAKFKYVTPVYSEFTFKKINDSIAYLCIPSFGDDNLDYESFYKKNFQLIDALNIKHLILDIQDNGGGVEGNENLLYSYFTDKIIQKYERVTMLPKPYNINREDEDYVLDKWVLKDTLAERGDYTLKSNYYSTLGYQKPLNKGVYHNALYVLISGETYSGGAEFASMIRMTNRGRFVGEETGGTYEGNVSGYSETIELPYTKISVDIPTVHFMVNVHPKIAGRGVIPDYTVSQTWGDYLQNKNSKLNYSIKLITK